MVGCTFVEEVFVAHIRTACYNIINGRFIGFLIFYGTDNHLVHPQAQIKLCPARQARIDTQNISLRQVMKMEVVCCLT
jgi:hypothetical protein